MDMLRSASPQSGNCRLTHAKSIEVGVIVAKERISNPWQPFRWRPLAVELDPPPRADWTEIAAGEDFVHYHAATLPLELHRKEAISYVANLETGEPSVYVVLRIDPEAAREVTVVMATASPYEAQAYGESGQETIEPVAMPPALLALLEAFVAEHHVEEKFVKRQRQKHHKEEEHLFGKEPIFAAQRRFDPIEPSSSDE